MEMEVIDFVHYPVAFSYPWLAGKKMLCHLITKLVGWESK